MIGMPGPARSIIKFISFFSSATMGAISELFYPHYELIEWIERGGSYGVLLALWFALDLKLPKVSVTGWTGAGSHAIPSPFI